MKKTHSFLPGEIAVIATDTVYGVAARALDPVAVERLYVLKRREQKPGTVIAASVDQLVELGVRREQLEPVRRFWPGPVSVVVPVDEHLTYLHQGKGSLALRIPADDDLREWLDMTGPLVTSSANQPGEPPATTVEEARAYFGDAVEWYEDAGTRNGEASTIISVNDGVVTVLRQGAARLDV